jgi:hypothetical protein
MALAVTPGFLWLVINEFSFLAIYYSCLLDCHRLFGGFGYDITVGPPGAAGDLNDVWYEYARSSLALLELQCRMFQPSTLSWAWMAVRYSSRLPSPDLALDSFV